MEFLNIFFRTVLLYVLITILYRFMGKREIGQLGIVDLIVSILIAELAAGSIENRDESIFFTIFPIVLLVIIQILVSLISLKCTRVRNVFDGKVSIIIKKGKIRYSEMIKQRYNMDDLLTQLREKGVRTIEEVDYALLENSGNLSVFKKDSNYLGEFPMPVILDGEIDNNTLLEINKSKQFIIKLLKDKKLEIKDIFYGFYYKQDLFIIKYKDLEK